MSNSYMGRGIRLSRVLRYTGLGILLLLMGTIAAVPIQQQVLSWRGERLLADICSLNLRKSDWADAQRILTRWGAWGHYDGTCSEHKCLFRIELGDFLTTHPYLADRLIRWRLLPVYRLLNGRPSLIRAHLSVVDGLVWGKSFSLSVEVPPERGSEALFDGYGYALIGSSESVSRFAVPRSSFLVRHPDYIVRIPGGCTGCLAIFSQFTPFADPGDIQRLMRFDMSCLTRRRRCRTQAEIMPAAWVQRLEDISNSHPVSPDQMCASYPLSALGRDTANAAIVDVVANRGGKGETLAVSSVRLVSRLKAASFWEVGTTREVPEIDRNIRVTDDQRPKNARPVSRFILLFDHRHYAGLGGPEVWLDDCGAVPMTEHNLEEIRRGIDQDYLSARPDNQ